jgi:hypothetical protein
VCKQPAVIDATSSSVSLRSSATDAERRAARRWTHDNAALDSSLRSETKQSTGFTGDVVRQVLDDLDGLGVRPLQVLEQEHAAGIVADGGEHPEHGLAQDHERLLRRGLAGDAPLRDESAEDRPKRCQLRDLRRSRPAKV